MKSILAVNVNSMYAAEPGQVIASLRLKPSAKSADIASLLQQLNAGTNAFSYSVVGGVLEMRRTSISDLARHHPARAVHH